MRYYAANKNKVGNGQYTLWSKNSQMRKCTYASPAAIPDHHVEERHQCSAFEVVGLQISFLLCFLFLLHRSRVTSIKKSCSSIHFYLIWEATLTKKKQRKMFILLTLSIKSFFHFYQLDTLVKTHLFLKTDEDFPSLHTFKLWRR